MPLVELVKNEMFRKPILEALELETTQTSTDSINLQDDKPVVVLSPMIEPTDNNSPSFYVSLTIHDLFPFDSRNVKCLGLIKDLAITLTQLPMKSMMMDIVVADVPPKFGMLLSKGWIKRLCGTLQNDISYATVPVFGGKSRRLYKEA